MSRIKVFGGLTMVNGNQVRTIVAASSMKKGCEIAGVSLNEFSNYWSVTRNKVEIEYAMSNVGKALRAKTSRGYEFS